jgi:hypothetical protein
MYQRTDIMNTAVTCKKNKGSIKAGAFADFLQGQNHVENSIYELINGQKSAYLSKCKMKNKIF